MLVVASYRKTLTCREFPEHQRLLVTHSHLMESNTSPKRQQKRTNSESWNHSDIWRWNTTAHDSLTVVFSVKPAACYQERLLFISQPLVSADSWVINTARVTVFILSYSYYWCSEQRLFSCEVVAGQEVLSPPPPVQWHRAALHL